MLSVASLQVGVDDSLLVESAAAPLATTSPGKVLRLALDRRHRRQTTRAIMRKTTVLPPIAVAKAMVGRVVF